MWKTTRLQNQVHWKRLVCINVNDYLAGIELFQVALHEFGHSVGLHHSEVNGSVMAPFFIGYIPSFDLHEDDIAGIQKIYGEFHSINMIFFNSKQM